MIVTLTAKEICEFFTQAKSQSDYLISLYKRVIPDWDKVKTIQGWPKCGEKLWKYIATHAMSFDKVHHPDCMAGGAWMNKGFSSSMDEGDPMLGDWDVLVDPSKIEYEEQACEQTSKSAAESLGP